VREYPITAGCEVDVMHAQERSILRQNIRRDIVYYYPFDDYKAIKNFNVVKMVSVGEPVMGESFRDNAGISQPGITDCDFPAFFRHFQKGLLKYEKRRPCPRGDLKIRVFYIIIKIELYIRRLFLAV